MYTIQYLKRGLLCIVIRQKNQKGIVQAKKEHVQYLSGENGEIQQNK